MQEKLENTFWVHSRENKSTDPKIFETRFWKLWNMDAITGISHFDIPMITYYSQSKYPVLKYWF